MTTLHHLNILLHVLAGTIALITGFVAALAAKGGNTHNRFGRYFTRLVVVVIATALAGVFVFGRNNFLLVITLLSGYTCFSGFRAVKLRGSRPALVDYLAPVAVMASAFYYLYYVLSQGLYWAPVLTYSTIGALFVVTIYDLSKMFLPAAFLKKAVLYEHSYKMIGSLSGLASAFSGTVLPQYHPYSQFLPSMAGIAAIIIIFIRLGKQSLIVKTNAVTYQAH